MHSHPDIDLDFGSRDELLKFIDYTSASLEDGKKHASGIYVTAIPQNPLTGFSSINYKEAEELGYFKLDILNQSVYKMIKSPEHLEELLSKPIPWHRLQEEKFVEKLIHIGNYFNLIQRLPEPIASIEELAMFLAILRPGKKHLQGLPWHIIEKSVWDRESTDGYTFRKAHGLAYSYLVSLAMRAIDEVEKL